MVDSSMMTASIATWDRAATLEDLSPPIFTVHCSRDTVFTNLQGACDQTPTAPQNHPQREQGT